MAIRQVYLEKDPRVILKRLSVSLTHPYQCNECQQRFHKVYEVTDHYVTAHQKSNELSEKEVKVKVSKFQKQIFLFSFEPKK